MPVLNKATMITTANMANMRNLVVFDNCDVGK
jgi:hypothetical protein